MQKEQFFSHQKTQCCLTTVSWNQNGKNAHIVNRFPIFFLLRLLLPSSSEESYSSLFYLLFLCVHSKYRASLLLSGM